jgi:hypothetical protein
LERSILDFDVTPLVWKSHRSRYQGRTVVMEADDADQYEYSQLNGPDAIRLIHLQPCKNLEAGIECSLKDATLAEYRDDICDHYIAISYVWGDQDDTRTISVDGKRLQITASLDSALRYVRDHRRALRVWADGVCINQKDVHERNRQVRLMGDIYSIAQHTIIFLGLSSLRCDSVLQSIASGYQPPVQSEESLGTSSQEIPTRQFETIVEDEILSRPWFTRVWILQELVFSQNPWLQCGSSRVRWHMFCSTVLRSEHWSWRPGSLRVLTHMSERWIQARRDHESHPKKLNREAPGKDLLELVCDRARCSLSDPRDMIYAHLGLVSAETRNMIPIDYEKTVAQLYMSMTELYAQWIGIWNVIILAGVEPEQRRDPSLPSWVVDWSLSKPWWSYIYSSDYSDAQDNLRPHSLAVPHVLAVSGRNHGPIDSIIPASSWPTISDPWIDIRPMTRLLKRGWQLLDDLILPDILDWALKSGNNVLCARRLLVDFTVSMANKRNFVVPSEYQHWGGNSDSTDSNHVLRRKVIIAISQWPELSTTPRPRYWKNDSNFRGAFIRLCLRNLASLAACYSGNACVAVLKSTRRILALVPDVAQPGDFVADIHMNHGLDFSLFRPCDLELNHEEEELIRNDFEVRYPPTTELPKAYNSWPNFKVPFQNCRYVAQTANTSYTDRTGEAPWSSRERTIFALH